MIVHGRFHVTCCLIAIAVSYIEVVNSSSCPCLAERLSGLSTLPADSASGHVIHVQGAFSSSSLRSPSIASPAVGIQSSRATNCPPRQGGSSNEAANPHRIPFLIMVTWQGVQCNAHHGSAVGCLIVSPTTCVSVQEKRAGLRLLRETCARLTCDWRNHCLHNHNMATGSFSRTWGVGGALSPFI